MKIYGASGHGKVIAEIAEQMGKEDFSFVDDHRTEVFFNKPVVPREAIGVEEDVLVAIGDNRTRKLIVQALQHGCYCTLVHSDTTLSNTARFGRGVAIMAGVRVNADTIVKDHVILNTNCSVDHDCEISDYVHISPGANLAGNVFVGEGTHIGIGASIIQGIRIGKWVTVGAGAVIINDLPDFSVVVGVPGKIIKYTDERI